MTVPSDPRAALDGIRVLDFSIMLAGPYCARMLADVGAEVIKIEPPEGDDMRQRAPLRNGHSTYFGQLNAGKHSITLNLKTPEAIAIVHGLVAKADVIVENFRPGVMDRLGLGEKALRQINPRLVYCSISGYGQTGPAAARPAYAMMVHAASGFDRTLMQYAGDRDRPAPGAVFVADVLGGIFGFSAIQTALVQRGRTGVGQYIDVALMDCMSNLLVYELQEAQFPVTAPRPVYAPVKAQDGDLLIAPITERNFSALCEATGLTALRSDERFATLPSRSRNWQAMMDVVEGWTRERSVTECVQALDRAGVPCSAYADPSDTLADPHLIQRGLFRQVSDGAGRFTGINPPWRMSGTRAEVGDSVPAVGEHTQEILDNILGLSPSEQALMRAAGAFGVAKP